MAVAEGDEADFFAFEEFFHHHARAGITKLVVREHHLDCTVRFFQCHCYDNTLASGQAIGLDDDRCAFLRDVIVRGFDVGEGLVFRRWNGVALHEGLGEVLRTFQLCSFFARAKNFQATGTEQIDDTSSQRHFWADHGQGNMFFFDKIGQFVQIGNGHVLQALIKRCTAIARCDIDGLDAG